MNNRRDELYGREQFGRHNHEWDDERNRDREGNSLLGRGQEDWRNDSARGGWGKSGSDDDRFTPRYGRGGERYYGYGEGARGGYSYGSEMSRRPDGYDPRDRDLVGQRRWANEGLANDFSVEGTHHFSREERRSHARGYGVESAFEDEGHVRVSHRGKGPKGFKRSDERIKEVVCEALADHHEIDASDIEVNVKEGEVTLSGTVTDRRTKRLAEDVIEHLSGVVDVHNMIRIKREETSQTTGQNGRTSITTTTAGRPH